MGRSAKMIDLIVAVFVTAAWQHAASAADWNSVTGTPGVFNQMWDIEPLKSAQGALPPSDDRQMAFQEPSSMFPLGTRVVAGQKLVVILHGHSEDTYVTWQFAAFL